MADVPRTLRGWLLLVSSLAPTACSLPGDATSGPVPGPAALPQARHGHRIERLRDGWLCFGGFSRTTDDRGTRETWFLPDGATEWRRCADLTHGQAFFASASDRDGALAIGAAIERYVPELDTWRVLTAPGRLPESHLAAALHDGRIYVLGGFPSVGTGFHVADPATGTVAEAQPPPSYGRGDHFHFVASVAGALHVLGGMKGEPWGMSREHWTLQDGTWRREADLPAEMWAKFGACVARGDELYLFGDFGGHRLDARRATWHALAPLPQPIVMPALVDDGRDLWIVGGSTVEPGGLGTGRVLWRYDVAADRWHDLSP